MTNDTSREAIAACKDKLIIDATLHDNELALTFEDDTRLTIADEGQQCCERRWMSTDDNLADIIGTTLLDVVQTDGRGTMVPPGEPDEFDHDVVFVRVTTTGGPVVLVNHNDHNGYYGGFVLAATLGRRH